MSSFFIKIFWKVNLTSLIIFIDFELIIFVCQIENYRALIKVNLFRTASKNILILINNITNRYSRSSRSQSILSNTREIRQSKSFESLIFLDNWRLNRLQLLLDIRKLYLNCIDYRKFYQYFLLENQINKNIISILSKTSIQLLSNINETTLDKFSLKS